MSENTQPKETERPVQETAGQNRTSTVRLLELEARPAANSQIHSLLGLTASRLTTSESREVARACGLQTFGTEQVMYLPGVPNLEENSDQVHSLVFFPLYQ